MNEIIIFAQPVKCAQFGKVKIYSQSKIIS